MSVELLAPAGNADCIRAAIENGADAVYFGLDRGHNARVRAANFSLDTLPETLDELHRRGLRGYVTLNTLAFSSELAEIEQLVRAITAAGVDAVLVQDLGVARLVRQVSPALEMHASTQMSLTSAECIAAIRDLSIARVVLPRELSIDEIRQVHAACETPLEAFVHGALCVAYSGQCLTSESLGGRSANRGHCAQACRLPYEITCDGEDVDLGAVKYLLSPQDLAAYELIPAMLAAGVTSFKIEGRLKTPEYVANVTRHYRQALDAALADRPVQLAAADARELELSFSRGFSPGWLAGCDHKMLVPGTSSAKRGVRLGQILSTRRGRVKLRLEAPAQAGDGVVFEGDRAAGEEQGGRVFEVYVAGKLRKAAVATGEVELTFAAGAIDFSRLTPGQTIWKTDDPALTKRLRRTFTQADPTRKVRLALEVVAEAGRPLRMHGRAANGAVCRLASDQPLEVARKHPLTEEVLRQQLGRLGGSIYELGDLAARIAGEPMVPLSVLGSLRRAMLEQLAASAAPRVDRPLAAEPVLPQLTAAAAGCESRASERHLRVLCRTLPQLEAVYAADVASATVDLQDIRQFRDAVAIARTAGREIYLATPRIQKPGEMGVFKAMLKHGADGVLARNLAGLEFFVAHDVPVVADFSLNAANELTAEWLRQRGSLRVTASYDLNREQLLELAAACQSGWLEVVIHQHMPMFHMEHCVFCAVLSPGTNKTNCGRPCDEHRVELRDRIGMLHPLKADVGCRNTLFNATPQSAAEAVPALVAAGVRHFRVELLDDDPAAAQRIVGLYQELLNGAIPGREVWRRLQAANRVGVTRGTLEARRNPLAVL